MDFGEIFEKNRFWSCFGKKFDFGQNFRKMWIFFRKFRKNFYLVKFPKKFRFWSKLAIISKNVDFSQVFEKFRFGSNFPKISIYDHDFRKKFEKSTILDKIGENFWNNVDFSQVFKDIWFWSKFTKTDFLKKIRKMSILFKFLKIFDFGQNLRISRFFFRKCRKVSI